MELTPPIEKLKFRDIVKKRHLTDKQHDVVRLLDIQPYHVFDAKTFWEMRNNEYNYDESFLKIYFYLDDKNLHWFRSNQIDL